MASQPPILVKAIAPTPPLAKRLAALPEPAMRAAAVVELLLVEDPDSAAALLEGLIRGARAGDTAALAGYASLVDPDVAGEALASERIDALVLAAESLGHVLALQWLMSLRPAASGEGFDGDKMVHRDLRKYTLGDRRALARRASGEWLKRLLVDPDPAVILNLLNNPRTTEEVAVAIAARRPTVPAPLLCLLRSARWNQRYRVKVALARNPNFPTRYGINLLVYLNDTDLTQIRDDGTLAQALRLAAKRLLEVGRLG